MDTRIKLRRLRYERTRTSNQVKSQIEHLLKTPAKWDMQGRLVEGTPEAMTVLQSWWPCYSDILKKQVQDAVRAGRRLQAADGANG